MKTRDWLLAKLIETSIQAESWQVAALKTQLGAARDEVVALKKRVEELVPQKQFVVKESSLAGEASVRTIQSVHSAKGVTTITL